MAKDGILVRIRVPGGLISTDKFRLLGDLAQEFASGYIEITARANVQLRGIDGARVEELRGALEKFGFLPSRLHDRIRNILASPLAGIDPEELIDTQPIVRNLDECLQNDKDLAKLPAKFGFAVDGGGYRFDRGGTDLALSAERIATGLQFRLFIGVQATDIIAAPGEESELLLKAARACLEVAKEFEIPARGRSIIGHTLARERFLQCLKGFAQRNQHELDDSWKSAGLRIPFGVMLASRVGRIAVIPSVPLARLTAAQVLAVSHICEEHGAGVRVAPWRGIVLSEIRESSAGQVCAALENIGLPVDGRDGFQGLAACAGTDGCSAALADVRADAVVLAGLLAGLTPSPGWKINLAGCEKRCGMRTDAMMDLIGTASGYSVHMQGRPAHTGCSPEKAIRLAASFRKTTVTGSSK